MPKTLVLFHSRTGHTARLADAVADGIRSVPFAEVDVRRIDDLVAGGERSDATTSPRREETMHRHRVLSSVDVLEDYDGLILGSPARYGVMAAEVQHVLDAARALQERGALVDRVGAAFASAAAGEGGAESTVWSMLMALSHFGMLLVPPVHAAGSALPGTPATAASSELGTALDASPHHAHPHDHEHGVGHGHDHGHTHAHHAHEREHHHAVPAADAPPPPADPALAAAHALGRRVATVVEWVTHVRRHH